MIPITKPTLASYKKYSAKFEKIIKNGQLTNGRYVAMLEEAVRYYLGVKYCVAVSSCTSGLMLVLKALNLRGEVILPSFTFSASGHVLLWNNLKPVFADIDKNSYNIDPSSIEKLITPKTSAILATHVFGNPCPVPKLESLAKKRGLKLIFDAAHGLGSSYHGKMVGSFGCAEVFSCSPTKLMTTGEGGFITTNNKKIADLCRIGRNYGDDGSYNTRFNGLSARMSEFHAVVGLESLKNLDRAIKLRNQTAQYYKTRLSKIDPDLIFQRIGDKNTTTRKDFPILIDSGKSGYNRDNLHNFLASRGVITKKYFYPPLHLQHTYRKLGKKYDDKLPITRKISENILCLPLFSHISRKETDVILGAIKKFYDRKKNKKIYL